MALGQSLVTHHLSPPLFLLLTSSRVRLPPVFCSSSRDAPFTEQEVLRFVAESPETTLPCIRTYENDLSRLSLVGAVSFDQALMAAAADGGRAASEHVDSGLDAMVVETMFPEPNDDHASLSTRLFLPAKKVEEKAAQLRKSLSRDILSGGGLRDILAMTFRQVVLHRLWNFELFMFSPGTERNMAEIVKGREVPVSFSLSSSDEHVISLLAEVVCVLALQSTEKHFVNGPLETNSSNFFRWFRKPERIVSKDSSVALHKLFDEEIVENGKSLFKSFISKEDSLKSMKMSQKNQWWMPSVQSELEKIGGPEFSAWASEYVPAYRLQIDSSRLKDLKLRGWRKLAMNRWEVLLTHCQMVGLANILDIYFEDFFTLPGKQLGCRTVGSHKSFSNKKSISSLSKFLSATLASGVLLVTLGLFGQLCLPHLSKGGKFPGQYWTLSTAETGSATRVSTDTGKIVEASHLCEGSTHTISRIQLTLDFIMFPNNAALNVGNQLESACESTIGRIKDCFRWPGDITMETSFGTWIGEVPDFLRMSHQVNCSTDEMLTDSADFMKSGAAMEKSSAQEVASFQVVLSTDGKIIGFQPTSRAGVNNWAVNPLARELYGGRHLSPGFLELGLNVSLPDEIVVIELLMSVNSDTFFAFARPVQ